MRSFSLLATLAIITALAASAPAAPNQGNTATAIFAGGCFWCMEPPFDKLDGVISTTSGYTGGTKVDPSYNQVSSGSTKHREAVQIVYDPKRVSYEKLLEVFWRNIDPLDGRGQFCDKGRHYTSAIFALDDAQRVAAEESKAAIESGGKLNGKIRTEILTAGPSTRPKITTRTTTRRTRYGINTTAGAAAATLGCRSCGARRLSISPRSLPDGRTIIL